MGLKCHQCSPDTHVLTDMEPHNIRESSKKISNVFFLTALYGKPTAHFWLHLYKCGAPFSHPYPQCGKSDFNGVFKLPRKQKPNTPNTFPSRAEIWCYSINHLIRLGSDSPEPRPQHCIAPTTRAFQVLNTGIRHKKVVTSGCVIISCIIMHVHDRRRGQTEVDQETLTLVFLHLQVSDFAALIILLSWRVFV